MVKMNDIDGQKQLKHNAVWYTAFVFMLLMSVCNCIRQIIDRMTCELQYSFTWDNPIYWTVGRGYLNGLKPYADLFETKPPGIFLLSAFSFIVNGDVFIGNIFSFICLVIIGSVPLMSAILIYRNRKAESFEKALMYTCAGAFGACVMLYSQIRSGQMQVEALGAAFICLYVLVVFNIDTDKAKPYSPAIFLAALFVMGGVMFKEPFLLVALASVLFFTKTIKDFVYKLVLPILYGGVLGIVVMTFTGTLGPYITIYLPHMTGNHVSIHGSPFRRGFDIRRILDDLGKFSGGLQVMIIIIVLVSVIIILNRTGNDLSSRRRLVFSVIDFVKVVLIVYLVSFSVGLGGQYYNHHYVFAVPFYIAAFIFIVKEIESRLKVIIGVLLIISSSVFYLLPDYQYDQNVLDAYPVIKQQAEYVDGLLEHYETDRYQYLGFNGNRFYGLTEHSPLGPVFIQDPNNFKEDDTWFTRNLRQQMEEAQILIVEKLNAPVMNDELSRMITEDFTLEPWDDTYNEDVPEDFEYTIYYRVRR
ncbi:MAG: hypothetical protein PHV88_00780 [Eubacteriales bacterium]|nr:hypothetical protein [Eubacteriales bacterium]